MLSHPLESPIKCTSCSLSLVAHIWYKPADQCTSNSRILYVPCWARMTRGRTGLLCCTQQPTLSIPEAVEQPVLLRSLLERRRDLLSEIMESLGWTCFQSTFCFLTSVSILMYMSGFLVFPGQSVHHCKMRDPNLNRWADMEAVMLPSLSSLIQCLNQEEFPWLPEINRNRDGCLCSMNHRIHRMGEVALQRGNDKQHILVGIHELCHRDFLEVPIFFCVLT